MGLPAWNLAASFSSCHLLEIGRSLTPASVVQGTQGSMGRGCYLFWRSLFSLDLFLLAHLSSLEAGWVMQPHQCDMLQEMVVQVSQSSRSCSLEMGAWGWCPTAVLEDRGQRWKKALLGKQMRLGCNLVDFTSMKSTLICFLCRHVGPGAFKVFQGQTLRGLLIWSEAHFSSISRSLLNDVTAYTWIGCKEFGFFFC